MPPKVGYYIEKDEEEVLFNDFERGDEIVYNQFSMWESKAKEDIPDLNEWNFETNKEIVISLSFGYDLIF